MARAMGGAHPGQGQVRLGWLGPWVEEAPWEQSAVIGVQEQGWDVRLRQGQGGPSGVWEEPR